jgi:hypothetical protein
MGGGNSHQRAMKKTAKGSSSTTAPPRLEHPLSPEAASSARTKSMRQLAAELAGLFGLGYTWWALTEPRDNHHLIIGFGAFLAFLFCLWSLINDLLRTHRRKKIAVVAFLAVFFVGLEGAKIYNRIYRPNFCYGFMYIHPPNVKGPPYRLGLNVVNAEPMENVSVAVMDVSGMQHGDDATAVMAGARYLYAPIVYALYGTDTNVNLECDGQKEYLFHIITKGGMFQEELKCKDNDIAGQTINLARFPPTKSNILVEDWKPINNTAVKRSFIVWLLDLCD